MDRPYPIGEYEGAAGGQSQAAPIATVKAA
jgi:hypothetical protein